MRLSMYKELVTGNKGKKIMNSFQKIKIIIVRVTKNRCLIIYYNVNTDGLIICHLAPPVVAPIKNDYKFILLW